MKLRILLISSKWYWLFILSMTISLLLKISLVYIKLNLLNLLIVSIIKDVLLRMNLKLKYCQGQCYDGASNMTGIRNGVAKQLTDKEPQAIFTHCSGHALNLVEGDTVKKCKLTRSCLDAEFEITELIRKSPRRDAIFQL